MAAISIAGPQFGGKTLRTHVDLPKHRPLSIRRMPTSDLKVSQAILSEELRIARVTAKERIPGPPTVGGILRSIQHNVFGWNATDRQIRAMEARLDEIGEEVAKRNLRDLKNGKIGWTRPRHSRAGFAVSLAEAAKVH
jgi:nitrogenase molybdenum-iron protein alpha/beta subunit